MAVTIAGSNQIIKQVVNVKWETPTNFTSTNETTFYTASITVSPGSKILGIGTYSWYSSGGGGWYGAMFMQVREGSGGTMVANPEHQGTITSEEQSWNVPYTFLTETKTSGGTFTYYINGNCITGGTRQFNRSGTYLNNRITLFEVSGQ